MCDIIITYSDNLQKVNQKTFDALMAKCPDGSYRMSKEYMQKYYNAIMATSDVESTFREQYYLYLEQYKAKLGLSVMTFYATLGIGRALNGMKDLKWFKKLNLNL